MSRPERRFAFRLAGHLGMTVESLLNQMSAAELAEWMAFYRVEPFGDPWAQSAQVCAMVGNAAGGKRGGRPFTVADFMPCKPSIASSVKRQTGQEMLAIFRMPATTTKDNK